jgi:GAF domain-containing protein
MPLRSGKLASVSTEWKSEDSPLRAALHDLATLLVREESLQTVLQRVVELARGGIGECDLASVTYLNDGRAETIVSTDLLAEEIDQAQYEFDAGPCLEAIRRQELVSVPSMADSSEWSEFRNAAMAGGVRSSFSIPLASGDVQVGALNLYGRKDHAFNSVPPDAALLFAEQAATAVWASRTLERTRDVVAHLETALSTREQIGIAVGIVMANEKLSSEEAFAKLVQVSQHRNVKLRDLAMEVSATGATPI